MQKNKLPVTTTLSIFQRFSALYNMFRPIWPSSGNTAVYEIRVRKLST